MEMISYLGEDGELSNDLSFDDLPFGDDDLVRGYRAMRRARLFDERAVVLQRQGKLGVYPPYRGQEAAQVGSVLPLEPSDWLVPSYRETGAAISHTLPLEFAILYWRADPAGWRFPDDVRILPFYIPIATQLAQAVGIGSAGRHQGEDWVVVTYIGDGGSSEGDFHEALNFAAVFDAPVVFVVQNNGWAISVPTTSQMKNTRIAERAAGYGFPGVRVDGNDLPAMWHTTAQAVERARAGEGPTLIEAVTYRIAPHTTSDDPGRYRDEGEAEAWLARDPIRRMRRLLERRELWDDAREEAWLAEAQREFGEALRRADAAPAPRPEQIVEEVFEEMTPDQRAAWQLLRERARESRGGAPESRGGAQ